MPDAPLPSALEVFEQVIALDPGSRRERITFLCAGNPGLLAQVEAMLAADRVHAPGLDRAGAGNKLLARELAWQQVRAVDGGAGVLAGRYQVLRAVGEGGMGVVYEAMQASPRRRVALKAMRPGLTSRSLLRRFAHEAQLL